MTRRTCRECGRCWLTFGPHDPCPDCGTVARLEIGSDVLPPDHGPRCIREDDDLWHQQPVILPMV